MTRAADRAGASPLRNRSYWAAFLLGIATMAAIDEIVFHQILAWHPFYDCQSVSARSRNDGVVLAGVF